jgi:hypothetical protein
MRETSRQADANGERCRFDQRVVIIPPEEMCPIVTELRLPIFATHAARPRFLRKQHTPGGVVKRSIAEGCGRRSTASRFPELRWERHLLRQLLDVPVGMPARPINACPHFNSDRDIPQRMTPVLSEIDTPMRKTVKSIGSFN